MTDPFYVFANGAREEPHWLAEHTGFGVDVSATRPLGSNARASLAWSNGSLLCDVGSGAGDCGGAEPPSGFTRVSTSVKGVYEPIPGDFDGDDHGDVFWYAPGAAPDYLWFGSATRGSFASVATSMNGTYQPIPGDFDGAAGDDVLWYQPGAGLDTFWYGD